MLEFLGNTFNFVLYRPLFNFLVLLYNYLPGHDFGIAIIFLTLIIRVLLYPISVKTINSQKNLQKLQPKMQEIQKKYKDDKEKQSKEILNLYKTEKINPFSGILLAIIQVPILIALYWVFWNGLNPGELSNLYAFIQNPGQIDPTFLNILNLSKPNVIFAILAGLTQYFQTKMMLPKKGGQALKNKNQPDFSDIMQKQMVYFFPVFTVIILLSLPSALGLYWTTSGVLSIIQQYFILKKSKND